MALNKLAFMLRNSCPHTIDAAPANFWDYATPDTVATVTAAGYFNNLASRINIGDMIDAICVAGTAGADRISVLCTANTGSVVTIAVNTDASAL